MGKWARLDRADSGGHSSCHYCRPSLHEWWWASNWYRVSLEITNLKKNIYIFRYWALEPETPLYGECGKCAATSCLWCGWRRWRRIIAVRKCEPCSSTRENDFPGSYMSCHVMETTIASATLTQSVHIYNFLFYFFLSFSLVGRWAASFSTTYPFHDDSLPHQSNYMTCSRKMCARRWKYRRIFALLLFEEKKRKENSTIVMWW